MRFALGACEEAVGERIAALGSDVQRIWQRDDSFWGDEAARRTSVANRLGWLGVVDLMRRQVDQIQGFAADVISGGFRDAVVLGMGGSSLAPEVLARSIGDYPADERGLRLHVLDTTDPATIHAVEARIDVARTLFFVSSKSGTTIEALSLFAHFHERVKLALGEEAGQNFVAITDEGTPLGALAKEHAFRTTFVNPSDIGGRYSALSYFGLVPAAVSGVDITLLLQRAATEIEDARTATGAAARLGTALAVLARKGRDKCTFLLSPRISSFGLWAEQLIAESTGKEGTGILPVDGEPLLSVDRYGDDRCFVFLRLDGDGNDALDGHASALEIAGHPVIRIELAEVYDLGREFFRWEFAVAVASHVLGINPFDEPNVQESKDNTNRVLAEFQRTGEIPIDAVSVGSAEMATSLEEFLDRIEPGGYVAVTAYVSTSAQRTAALDDMREVIGQRLGVATTLGYGPRFLHSTGQFHKGGPQCGAFLQVLGELPAGENADAGDIAIPNKPFTFAQLKRAQAAGDRQSLIERGRPVLTVDLGRDSLLLENLCLDLKEAIDAHNQQEG